MLKITARSLWRNKGIATINTLGLSIGLACCMLIAQYVFHETHFDRHHQRAEDLYRLGTTYIDLNGEEAGKELRRFSTSAGLAQALRQEFPEVEKTARTLGILQKDKTLLQVLENGAVVRAFNEPWGYFADSCFFDLFQYEFLDGNTWQALREPNSIVISEEIARKCFGTEKAVGRFLRVNNDWFEGGAADCRISGVIRMPQQPTQIKGRFFIAMHSGRLPQFLSQQTNLTRNNMFGTYVRLHPGSTQAALEAKMPALVEKYMGADLKARGETRRQFLTPMQEVHLSDVGIDEGVRPVTYLYILGSIALFTLLIACVNYMNLSTARAARRGAEVGARKAAGATQGQLIRQFLGESVLLSCLALTLAYGMASMAMPIFNQFTELNLRLSPLEQPWLSAAFAGLALGTGLLAGLYPAFYLSSFRPVEVLKGQVRHPWSGVRLRKALVVFQFVISAGLIFVSLVIDRQLQYLQEKDLGFERSGQLILPIATEAADAARPALQAALRADSRVAAVGASSYYPGIMNPSDGSFYRQGQAPEEAVNTRRNWVDTACMRTLGLEAVAGRLYQADYPGDTLQKMIINETAARQYGFASAAEAIQQPLKIRANNGQEHVFEIVGVVRDFHFESLHEPIQPYAFELSAGWGLNYLIVRIQPGAHVQDLIESVQQIWSRLVPGEPLEYSFLEDDFEKNYASDQRIAVLIQAFTLFAIFISCLGLLGLAAFAAEQRTREIGIRKVLGASVTNILVLLTADFMKLVLVAVVIAAPVAWYLGQRWLAGFAYRVDISLGVFVLAGTLACGIALLTVGYQGWMAAARNPVKNLRQN